MRRALAVLLLALSLGVVTIVAFTGRPSPSEIAGVAIGVLGLLGPLAYKIWPRAATDPNAELERHASDLAHRVGKQWRKEAADRGITVRATVPVRWTRAGPNASRARPKRHAWPRAIPFSGGGRLPESGDVQDLYRVYAHREVERMVIIGGGGSGKTGTIIQLLIEALDLRATARPPARFEYPVPVILSLGDWDPVQQSLIHWADGVLQREYGRVAMADGRSAWLALIEDHRIDLFLDGLEEMPERFWNRASPRIEQATEHRIVLTARPHAAEHVDIGFAAWITLAPVGVEAAQVYLTARVKHPELWEKLIDLLGEQSTSVVSRVLATPLMLTLAVDSYDRPDRDPTDLSNEQLFPNRRAMERHLIRQVIPSAFDGARAGATDPEGAPTRAEHYLRELALGMGESYDLKWWRIRDRVAWLPPTVVGVVAAVMLSVFGAWLGGPTLGLAMGIPGVVTSAFAAGATAAWATRRRYNVTERRPQMAASLMIGVLVGICLAGEPDVELARVGVGTAVGLGLVFGILGGCILGLLAVHDEGPLVARPRFPDQRDVLFGIPGGAVTGVTYAIATGSPVALVIGLISGGGFMLGVAWARPADHPEESATPLSSYLTDLRGGLLLGLLVGVTIGVALALVLSARHGLVFCALVSAAVALVTAMLTAAAGSQACALTLVSWYLHSRPAVNRLLGCGGDHGAPRSLLAAPPRGSEVGQRGSSAGFLVHAHERGVLREVGTIYQFRHARLTDELRGAEWDGLYMKDVFISCAVGDWDVVAKPIADELARREWTVWRVDVESTGNRCLASSVDRGVSKARYGLVLLGPAFFARGWPASEFDDLASRWRDESGRVAILPVCHDIDSASMERLARQLAMPCAVSWTSAPAPTVVDEIERALGVSD